MKNTSWILKMALKDAAKNRRRLIVYASSIIIGIASLVAIQSFRESLSRKIDLESKELLGADLVIRSRDALTKEELNLTTIIQGEKSYECSFATMLAFPKGKNSRLIFARGIEGTYPFYGKVETDPPVAMNTILQDNKVLVDKTVMLQLGIQVNDTIKLGQSNYVVAAAIIKTPGSTGIGATVAPPVYFPLKTLEATGLKKEGSRLVYRTYYKSNELPDKATLKKLEDELYTKNIIVETVESRKAAMREVYAYLNNFLNLIGFISLLLGCIGIASSVSIYLKEKRKTIATLRCLGTSSRDIFKIFFTEVTIIGIIGSLIGVILGSALQPLLSYVLSDVLIVDVEFAISPNAMINGLITGALASILFTIEPLLSSKSVPPLSALNNSTGVRKSWSVLIISRAAIISFVLLFSYLQLISLSAAALFTLSLIVILLVLAAVARLFMFLIKRGIKPRLPFVLKHGLSNIFRPNNQSTELTVTIGLGALMITFLFFVQSNLLKELSFADVNEQPNMILFDIQKDQLDAVKKLLSEEGMPIIQETPVIAMRLDEIKGRSRVEIKNDSTSEVPSHILEREWRTTYRDFLEPEEVLEKGEFIGDASGLDYVPVTLEYRTAEQMGVSIGDEIKLDVQGVGITTRINSIIRIKRNKIQTSFNILFPKGVLERAPQFYAVVSRTKGEKQSALFQQKVVKRFANVSLVDLNGILDTVSDVIGKIRMVIQFMALFSMITGLIVLIASISNSRFQRIKDAVLLRTLGASKKQISRITLIEYLALGFVASFSGVLLGIIASWLVTWLVFGLNFSVLWITALIMLTLIVLIISFMGTFNNRSVTNASLMNLLKEN